MHSLWVELNTHPNLKHLINDFYDEELTLRIEMSLLPVGNTQWCMCEMRRHFLLKQCKEECVKHFDIAPTHANDCFKCGMSYFIDRAQSIKVCRSCGTTIQILMDNHDFNDMKRYNRNRRHHYDPSEHFSQTLCDFTGIGARTIPARVFSYCLAILGKGSHITSQDVFRALQMGGYSAYYLHKYEITNRLRGKLEFKISNKEILQMKDVYKRYRQEFIPFQQSNCIGTYSKNGKPRIYWPMRYILKRVCDEIGRSDLKVYIRGVNDLAKIKLYDKYWVKLKHFIDSTRPKRSRLDPSLLAVQLRPRVLP